MRKDNYIGKKYGKLTVVSRVDDYVSPSGAKAARYLCKCDCGNEYITRGGWLSCGKSTCCTECSQKNKASKMTKDLSGLRFGRWTVINKATTKKQGVFWNCVCDCGNKGIVRGTSLTSGNSTSCGCFALEKLREDHLLNLVGQKFGRLTVIKQVDDFISPTNKKRRSRWQCQCDCGNEKIITKDSLMNGTISCRCVNSRGEREISEFLQEHCIDYNIQYSFNDLLGEGNVPLKFDFAIIDSLGKVTTLIEFQGEQHYEPIKFFGGEKKYQKQKRYDNLKRSYCKKHNITLIEISYKDSIEERLISLL